MEEKIYYKNKYKIKSIRWDRYDYSQDGFYFITICTEKRKIFFGDIINCEMILNSLGRLAVKYWLEIPNHFGNAILDEFIIMPNHIHGIIIINNKKSVETPDPGVSNSHPNLARLVETPKLGVSTGGHKLQWKSGVLGVIINQYKRKCTIMIHQKNNLNFAWQSRFYDRVIRTDEELYNIRQYIINNPIKWEFDRNNPANFN